MKALLAKKNAARVGILGGSFDPPHLGHQILALCALALENIDEVWVIPCADHPFSKKLSPFEHRLHMASLAFDVFGERVQVLAIEQDLPAPSYSVQTLEYIKRQNPSLDLTLIMGSDVYQDLVRWKNPERIAELCGIVVFQREGSPIERVSIPAKIHDDFTIPHVKSTDIREMIRNGKTDDRFVDRRVFEYMMRNELY